MTRDWLDEQMDEADYWHARRETQRDIIEAELPEEEDENPELGVDIGAHFDDPDNILIGPDGQMFTVRELLDQGES